MCSLRGACRKGVERRCRGVDPFTCQSQLSTRSGVNQHGEGATKGPTETWTIAININDTLAWLRYSLNRIAEAFSTGFVLVLRYCCWAMTLNLSVLSNFNITESKVKIIMFPTNEIDATLYNAAEQKISACHRSSQLSFSRKKTTTGRAESSRRSGSTKSVSDIDVPFASSIAITA
jgi:hypothetical protein